MATVDFTTELFIKIEENSTKAGSSVASCVGCLVIGRDRNIPAYENIVYLFFRAPQVVSPLPAGSTGVMAASISAE